MSWERRPDVHMMLHRRVRDLTTGRKGVVVDWSETPGWVHVEWDEGGAGAARALDVSTVVSEVTPL